MKTIPKPLFYILLLIGIAFTWARGLRYYVKITNPTIINDLQDQIKSNPIIISRLGNIKDVEENFEIYSLQPDSIRFTLVFQGDKRRLYFKGKATRLNEENKWVLIETDSIIK